MPRRRKGVRRGYLRYSQRRVPQPIVHGTNRAGPPRRTCTARPAGHASARRAPARWPGSRSFSWPTPNNPQGRPVLSRSAAPMKIDLALSPTLPCSSSLNSSIAAEVVVEAHEALASMPTGELRRSLAARLAVLQASVDGWSACVPSEAERGRVTSEALNLFIDVRDGTRAGVATVVAGARRHRDRLGRGPREP
jgi:hypothetical protein